MKINLFFLLIALCFQCEKEEGSKQDKAASKKFSNSEQLAFSIEEAKNNPDALRLTKPLVKPSELLASVTISQKRVMINSVAQEDLVLSISEKYLGLTEGNNDFSSDYAEYWLCAEKDCICKDGVDICARDENPDKDNLNKTFSYVEYFSLPAKITGKMSGQVRLCVDESRVDSSASKETNCGAWAEIQPFFMPVNTDNPISVVVNNIHKMKKRLTESSDSVIPLAKDYLKTLESKTVLDDEQKRLKPVLENMVNYPSTTKEMLTSGLAFEQMLMQAASSQSVLNQSEKSLGLTAEEEKKSSESQLLSFNQCYQEIGAMEEESFPSVCGKIKAPVSTSCQQLWNRCVAGINLCFSVGNLTQKPEDEYIQLYDIDKAFYAMKTITYGEKQAIHEWFKDNPDLKNYASSVIGSDTNSLHVLVRQMVSLYSQDETKPTVYGMPFQKLCRGKTGLSSRDEWRPYKNPKMGKAERWSLAFVGEVTAVLAAITAYELYKSAPIKDNIAETLKEEGFSIRQGSYRASVAEGDIVARNKDVLSAPTNSNITDWSGDGGMEKFNELNLPKNLAAFDIAIGSETSPERKKFLQDARAKVTEIEVLTVDGTTKAKVTFDDSGPKYNFGNKETLIKNMGFKKRDLSLNRKVGIGAAAVVAVAALAMFVAGVAYEGQARLAQDPEYSNFQEKLRSITQDIFLSKAEMICWQEELGRLDVLQKSGKKLTLNDITCNAQIGCSEMTECAKSHAKELTDLMNEAKNQSVDFSINTEEGAKR